MLTLQLKSSNVLAIEAEALRPDFLREKSVDDAKRTNVWCDGGEVEAGELFAIDGDPSDGCLRLEGDLSRVHRLGEGMQHGETIVEGNVGRHAGAKMRGGKIAILGDAGDWLGAEMRGGEIEVAGDAADYVGAAYRASPRGMRGGWIVVRGSAGVEVGHTMRRGMIVVGGDCGELAGYRMRAGSLFVFGQCGPRPGAEMVRGTVGLFGETPELLPTFAPACVIAPQVMGIVAGELGKLGFNAPREINLYNGDLLHGGRGEIFARAA